MLIVLAALLLAGCTIVTPAAPPMTTPASAGSDLRIARAQASPGNFIDLDPSGVCQGEYQILMNVYETLTLYNPPGSAEPVRPARPALATDWQVADDGLTWTFHLREGVTFHDGAPLDAAAIFIQDLPDPHIVAADLQGFVNYPAYNNTVFWVEVRR